MSDWAEGYHDGVFHKDDEQGLIKVSDYIDYLTANRVEAKFKTIVASARVRQQDGKFLTMPSSKLNSFNLVARSQEYVEGFLQSIIDNKLLEEREIFIMKLTALKAIKADIDNRIKARINSVQSSEQEPYYKQSPMTNNYKQYNPYTTPHLPPSSPYKNKQYPTPAAPLSPTPPKSYNPESELNFEIIRKLRRLSDEIKAITVEEVWIDSLG